MQITDKLWYVHEYYISQEYGGPEEGGWWFDLQTPTGEKPLIFTSREEAEDKCYELNQQELVRREHQEKYQYTSVLSDRSTFYSYRESDEPIATRIPEEWPHYE